MWLSSWKLMQDVTASIYSSRVSYNKDKPWYTSKETRLRLEKEEMFWSGNRDSFKV